jgi:ArsR family transcriptional regulator
MRDHLRVFKALSDKNRLRIMKMLEVKPMCVCEITSVLKLAPSTVSKHLSLLHQAGLIEDKKEGKWVNCRLPRESRSDAVSEILKLLRRTLPEDAQVVDDKKRAREADRVELCR